MAQTTTELGRIKVLNPDKGYDTEDGGDALHAVLTALYKTFSDNCGLRYTGEVVLADTATVQIEHNFGMSLAQMKVLFFDASLEAKKISVWNTQFTITEIDGDTIEIENVSGSSQTFYMVILPYKPNILWDDYDKSAAYVESVSAAIDISGAASNYVENVKYTGSAAGVCTIPSAAGMKGREITFLNQASVNEQLTITVSGGSDLAAVDQGGTLIVESDGTNWLIKTNAVAPSGLVPVDNVRSYVLGIDTPANACPPVGIDAITPTSAFCKGEKVTLFDDMGTPRVFPRTEAGQDEPVFIQGDPTASNYVDIADTATSGCTYLGGCQVGEFLIAAYKSEDTQESFVKTFGREPNNVEPSLLDTEIFATMWAVPTYAPYNLGVFFHEADEDETYNYFILGFQRNDGATNTLLQYGRINKATGATDIQTISTDIGYQFDDSGWGSYTGNKRGILLWDDVANEGRFIWCDGFYTYFDEITKTGTTWGSIVLSYNSTGDYYASGDGASGFELFDGCLLGLDGNGNRIICLFGLEYSGIAGHLALFSPNNYNSVIDYIDMNYGAMMSAGAIEPFYKDAGETTDVNHPFMIAAIEGADFSGLIFNVQNSTIEHAGGTANFTSYNQNRIGLKGPTTGGTSKFMLKRINNHEMAWSFRSTFNGGSNQFLSNVVVRNGLYGLKLKTPIFGRRMFFDGGYGSLMGVSNNSIVGINIDKSASSKFYYGAVLNAMNKGDAYIGRLMNDAVWGDTVQVKLRGQDFTDGGAFHQIGACYHDEINMNHRAMELSSESINRLVTANAAPNGHGGVICLEDKRLRQVESVPVHRGPRVDYYLTVGGVDDMTGLMWASDGTDAMWYTVVGGVCTLVVDFARVSSGSHTRELLVGMPVPDERFAPKNIGGRYYNIKNSTSNRGQTTYGCGATIYVHGTNTPTTPANTYDIIGWLYRSEATGFWYLKIDNNTEATAKNVTATFVYPCLIY